MEVCTPIGIRCSQNLYQSTGANSTWVRVHECGIEFAALHDRKLDPLMSEAAQADAFSKISDLMGKARSGTIDFNSRNPDSKVIEMAGYQHLLELRPKRGAATAFGKPVRLVRLYYVEPLWLSDKLVALHLATKPDGTDPNEEQNNAIRTAGKRADTWASYSLQLTE